MLGIDFKKLEEIKDKQEVIDFLVDNNIIKEKKFKASLAYEKELAILQLEMVRLQSYVIKNKKRVLVIFEGRDTAGKSGTISSLIQNLNPKRYRTFALSKPSEIEKNQWIFQRYFKNLPNEGELVFWDRSWYNRAVVDPIFGFCTDKEYNLFMNQVNDIERIFAEDDQGSKIREQLFKALEIKNFEFNAQGVELNQRYQSNAVISESIPEVFEKDEQLYLQATTRAGAKVPHTWLINAKGQKQSTLDITGKGRFTLLTGLSGKGWKQAVETLNLPYLDVIQIGSRDYRDVYGTWNMKSEIHESGAVLVRPDGYIAWRYQDSTNINFDYENTLKAVLKQIQLIL